ncbi:phage minor capsid protein [Herbidospora mongoliensis]|uniref:phage minor capsid protein n=1 Tax=Herbidospora mongoliensis TaxID=688067 RepID=UPI00082EA947|nr:phage minor capsid protein [Herbidospora mongoliensis]
MAVDQDLLDDIAASVADLYRSVETALVKTIAARLRADLALPSPYQEDKLAAVRPLREAAVSVISALQASKHQTIRDAVAGAYRHGSGSALTDLPDAFFPKSGIASRAEAARKTIPNTAVIENIAGALHRDLGRVEGNLLRNVLDAYRSVQAATAARIATGTETRLQASQAAWQALTDKGITSFVDSANRRWKLSSYAEMIGRTNIARAATQGQTDRLASLDVDLVYVSNHGQECKLCRPFEGKVLSLNGPTGDIEIEHATRDDEMVTIHVTATLAQAQSAGFQHPNCRHSVSAYTPGLTRIPDATADPEGDEARQRQRAIERAIRKHKEREQAALTPEARKAAAAKTREWQKAMRDHLAAHPKLKRLPYRERIGAGNIPPAGGPQGGPAEGLGPDVQPTLDGGPAPTPARRTPDQAFSAITEKAPGQLDLDDAIIETPAPAAPRRQRQRAVPKGAKPYHRALDGDQRALADALKPKNLPDDDYDEKRARRLGGASAETFLVDLANGIKVIRKRSKPGLDEMQDADAEQAAYMVARALDLRAPAVYRSDDTNLWMRYVDGHTSPEDAAEWGDEGLPRGFEHHPGTDEGRRLGLLDVLTGNIDRNMGNWLVDSEGHVVPIDHGLAWGDASYDPTFKFIRNPFTEGMEQENPFTAEDLAEVRQRLEQLRPDFEHLGKTSWLDYTFKALDYFAERATGTRNLIAGSVTP